MNTFICPGTAGTHCGVVIKKVKHSNRKRCKKCAKEEARSQKNTWYKKNFERTKKTRKETSSRWRKENPRRAAEISAKSMKKWRKENPESPRYKGHYYKSKSKKWREENPEQVKVLRRSLRARHNRLWERHKAQLAPRGCKGLPMPLEAYRKKLYYVDGCERPCWYCSGENNKAGAGLDRLDNGITYTVANTVPACRGCNVWRGHTHSVQETRDHFAPMRRAARECQ